MAENVMADFRDWLERENRKASARFSAEPKLKRFRRTFRFTLGRLELANVVTFRRVKIRRMTDHE